MAAIYGRARSTEAPMDGLEFTNRANTVPAWRVNSASAPFASSSSNVDTPAQSISNAGIKRELLFPLKILAQVLLTMIHAISITGTHSTAHPPPSPFDPKNSAPQSRPIFGENVHYLFKPPHLSQAQPQPPSSQPYLAQDIPDVIMRDAELSPQRPNRHQPDEISSRRKWKGDEFDKENESPERRVISNAAVRRLARRQNGELTSRSRRHRSRGQHGEGASSKGTERSSYSDDDDSDEYDEYGSPKKKGRAVTRNTSNHYTLNMPGPAPAKTDTPYVLLG